MRILLLGGTGAIGTHLAEVLSLSNVEIYITSRSYRKDKANIHYIKGNAKNVDFLSSIIAQGWDSIIDFMNYDVNEFSSKVQILLSKTKCYYFMSSSRVYADTKDELITESSPLHIHTAVDGQYLASNEYGLAKAKEEEILKDSNMNNWTIFRPYIIYSESRFQLGSLEKEDWLYRVLQGKKIVVQESLLNKYTTLTYSPDATDVMASIILQNNSQGEIYNIAGSSSCCVTWKEVLDTYVIVLEKLLCRKISVTYLTDSQVHQLRKGYTYYQISYDRMFNRRFDNKKIIKYKADNTYISIRKGLEKSLSEFIHSPQFIFTNQAQEALLDRFTGEYSNPIHIRGVKQKLTYLYYRIFKTY